MLNKIFLGALLFIISCPSFSDVYFAPIARHTCYEDESVCKDDAEREAMRRRKEAERRQKVMDDWAKERQRVLKEAEVREFTDKFGDHRRSEAEKLRQMRIEADAARGDSKSSWKPPASYKGSKPKTCREHFACLNTCTTGDYDSAMACRKFCAIDGARTSCQ